MSNDKTLYKNRFSQVKNRFYADKSVRTGSYFIRTGSGDRQRVRRRDRLMLEPVLDSLEPVLGLFRRVEPVLKTSEPVLMTAFRLNVCVLTFVACGSL